MLFGGNIFICDVVDGILCCEYNRLRVGIVFIGGVVIISFLKSRLFRS